MNIYCSSTLKQYVWGILCENPLVFIKGTKLMLATGYVNNLDAPGGE